MAERSLTIVTPTFSPETFGTPLYTTDMALGLRSAGWEVQVVTAQPFYPAFRRFEGYGRRTRRDEVDGIPVLRLPTLVPRPGRAASRAVTDLNFALQGSARSLLRQVPRTDAVLSVSPGTPLTALVGSLCAKPGGRHLCYVHDVLSGLAGGTGLTEHPRLTDLMTSFERWALSIPDAVATLSSEMRTSLTEIGLDGSRVAVSELWATVTPPYTPQPEISTLQYSGSLGLKHGLGDLLEVLAIFKGISPQTTTVLRGSGPQLSMIERKVREMRLPVFLEPPVPEERLAAALASSPIHLVAQTAGAASSVLPSKVINALAVGAILYAMAPPDSALARLAKECDAVVLAPVDDPERAAVLLHQLVVDGNLQQRRRVGLAYVQNHHARGAQLRRLDSLLDPTPADPGFASQEAV